MATATTANPAMMANPASERIAPKRLFAFIIMVFGMFMSILDIQIVSASLSEIQAGLSASQNLLRAGMSVYATVDTTKGAADADSDADLDAPATVLPK